MKRFIKCFLVYYLMIIYLEVLFKLIAFENINLEDMVFTLIFSLMYAMWLSIINTFLNQKQRFYVNLINLIIITFIFLSEEFSYLILGSTFSIYSLNLAGQAFDFARFILMAFKKHFIKIILTLVPVILYIIHHKNLDFEEKPDKLLKYIYMFIGIYLVTLLSLCYKQNETYSPYDLYFETHAPSITSKKLGLLTEVRLDLKRYLFGFNPTIRVEKNNLKRDKSLEYNEIDLKFNTGEATKYISDYLSNVFPTNKNKHTGEFKGKNIIYILAEGFNSIAVDKELTPTLYKLVNSGYKFENYYSPMFMSTTGGEYQFNLSLIPTEEALTKWKNGGLNLPYTIGNVFKNEGYNVYAYHNWTYSYYKRDNTMPEMGYENYIACGNGLEQKMDCNLWPTSDVEMINASVDDYINDDKFAVYYVTLSGHQEYNFEGNEMAIKNQKYVENLPYSEEIKAYLASQKELDKALKKLIKKLEKAKKLDDTVIVLSGDHYPYSLSAETINEISTYKRDETFGVNNSNLIIYNPSVKKESVKKLASSVDVLPTILNMYGINYDSRLLMGKDIFSNHNSLVIFSDYSWISEKGRFNATTGIFTKKDENTNIEEDYVSRINNEVQARLKVSTGIIDKNYYDILFNANK